MGLSFFVIKNTSLLDTHTQCPSFERCGLYRHNLMKKAPHEKISWGAAGFLRKCSSFIPDYNRRLRDRTESAAKTRLAGSSAQGRITAGVELHPPLKNCSVFSCSGV
jgi:hypothetical protein